MKNKLLLLASLLFVLSFSAMAQTSSESTSDIGSWLTLQLNKKIGEKGYAVARFEHRTENSMSSTQAFFAVAGAGVAFVPWLRTDISYEYWKIYPQPKNGFNCHRVVLSANGTLRREGLAVSLRERLEYAIPDLGDNYFTLRSRLRAQYTFQNCKFRPYAMAEIFCWDKWVRSLYYAGGDLVFDRHNSLDIFYMYHIQASGNPIHTFGLGYYFSF